MKVEFSRQALADLETIAAFYAAKAGPQVAQAVGDRLEAAIARIAAQPESSPSVAGYRHLRVAFLIRYPFRIFYRVLADRIQIVHIRHTSRQSWPIRQLP